MPIQSRLSHPIAIRSSAHRHNYNVQGFHSSSLRCSFWPNWAFNATAVCCRQNRASTCGALTLVLCPIGSLSGSTSCEVVRFALTMRRGQGCWHQRRGRFAQWCRSTRAAGIQSRFSQPAHPARRVIVTTQRLQASTVHRFGVTSAQLVNQADR
jgi:hypothetical protein